MTSPQASTKRRRKVSVIAALAATGIAGTAGVIGVATNANAAEYQHSQYGTEKLCKDDGIHQRGQFVRDRDGNKTSEIVVSSACRFEDGVWKLYLTTEDLSESTPETP